jgi:predicted transposase/invertase (TIGR01784 family)
MGKKDVKEEEKSVFINPLSDFGFKKLFGNKNNVELLIDFLNTVLRPQKRIVSLTYLNTEQLGKIKDERKAVFDTYCEDEAGNKFIIEVQNLEEKFFKNRCLFYSTFPIQAQAKPGNKWNFKLDPMVVICVMNFVFEDSDPEKIISQVTLLEKETGEIFDDTLTFWYLEMPKFRKKLEDVNGRLDQWFFALNHLFKLKEMPLSLQGDSVFNKLFMEAKISNFNPAEAEAYYASMKDEWDRFAIEETARDKGKREGMIEGKQKGKQEGKFEMALQMKLANEPIDKIAFYTGLQISQIEALC